jgi:hypothetical protein
MDLGKCLDGDFLRLTRDLVGVLTNIKISIISIEDLLKLWSITIMFNFLLNFYNMIFEELLT